MKFFKKNIKDLYHSSVEVDAQRILSSTTPFAIREAYRSLYTNIRYLPIEDRCRKIVITSAFPGEGKTSTSVNLAYTIASNSPESKILIIDADMRSPRVLDLMGITKAKVHGLSEYLANIDSDPNMLDTLYPNLKVLSSGAQNSNTPGLIASTRMKELIAYCNNTYDYVIIDTPPVNIVSDAIMLSAYVNGYILVCRADFSDINSLSDATDRLSQAGAVVFGTVLSSYNAKSGRKYGKYGKYGRYGRYGKYGRYGRYGRYGANYGTEFYAMKEESMSAIPEHDSVATIDTPTEQNND